MSLELDKLRRATIGLVLESKGYTDKNLKEILDEYMCVVEGRRLTDKEKKSIYEDLTDKLNYEKRLAENQYLITKGIALTDPGLHNEWRPDKESRYYWKKLKRFLEKTLSGKHGADKAADIIRSLDNETEDILVNMEDPLRNEFDWRGLVIGYVQSGKTANFTALAAKAADSGYNLIIVLAGLWDSLRQQTQIRTDRELTGMNDLDLDGDFTAIPEYNKQWQRLTRAGYLGTDEAGEFRETNLDTPSVMFSDISNPPAIAIVKKNVSVLDRLMRWLSQNGKGNLNISALIIDDEADQASIDTNSESVKETDPTAINSRIRELLSVFRKRAYIGYTATPFANVLIGHNNYHENLKDDLYPRNYIHYLPAPEGYFGTEKMFGEGNESLFVGITSDTKTDILTSDALTNNLREAINMFLLSSAVRYTRGDEEKPMSMLIHFSHLIADMQTCKLLADEYTDVIRTNIRKPEFRHSFFEELKKLYEEDFRGKMQEIQSKFELDYYIPEFKELEKYIISFLSDLLVKELNSLSEDALDYAKYPSIKLIAIGGNQLSRGLTLEGLSTSYYLRDTRNNDTLLQMARWFGYRTGYEDLVRLVTQEQISEHFEYLASVEVMFWDEIEKFRVEENLTPRDFAPAILDHRRMNVTSRNKMGKGRSVLTFSETIKDVTWLPLNEKHKLIGNLNAAGRMIRNIDAGFKKEKGSYIATDADYRPVLGFLGEYFHPEPGIRKTVMNEMLEYIEGRIEEGELKKWNVAIIGNANGDPSDGNYLSSWEGLQDIYLVQRNRLRKYSMEENEFNIGAVSTQADRRIDKRDEAETDNPLLLIYRIWKGSTPHRNLSTREALFAGFSEDKKSDVLAFSIIFPRTYNEKMQNSFIQQKL
jgi:hypothetical protein